MTATRANSHKYLFFFGVLASVIFLLEWWLVHSPVFQRNPDVIAVGVTFDIVAVIPALFYFLVIRPRQSSPIFVLPSFLLCLFVASKVVPTNYHAYLLSVGKLLPLIEPLLLIYVATKVPGFIRSYREARKTSIYGTDAILTALRSTIADRVIVSILAVEAFLMYFAVAGWFRRWKDPGEGRLAFTYHKKSGYSSILGVLCFVMIVETGAVHVIVAQASVKIAWLLTFLSIYGALWLIGDFHAIRLHPIVLEPGMLHLRTGLRWRAEIPVEQIQDLRIGKPANAKSKNYAKISILWPRAVLCLKSPVTVSGLFGMKRTVTQIGVSLDEPEQLREALGIVQPQS